jgi:hypothetical protein
LVRYNLVSRARPLMRVVRPLCPMDSILNGSDTWYLDRLVFGDRLEVYIVEGIRASEPTDIHVGDVTLSGTYAMNITPASRRVVVIFDQVLTFLVTNESYATPGEGDRRSDGILCRYEQSSFLDYVRTSTLVDVLGPNEYSHFGLLLADDIIDVASASIPRVEVVGLA